MTFFLEPVIDQRHRRDEAHVGHDRRPDAAVGVDLREDPDERAALSVEDAATGVADVGRRADHPVVAAVDLVIEVSELSTRRDGVIAQRAANRVDGCLLYTSPSPRDVEESRMPSSA